MTRIETPLEAVLKGALAGLAGGIAITLAVQSVQQFMALPISPLEAMPSEEPKGKLVHKVAFGICETGLSEEERGAFSQGLHWAYSAIWGSIYGIVKPSLGLPDLLGGLSLGVAVWLVGPALFLPAMKLAPPQQSAPPSMIGLNIGFHAIYGLITAITFRLLASCRDCK